MKKGSSEYDNKKIDIGLKKKELEEKYGAQFFEQSEIPPEMESAWLKNIEKFEEQYAHHKKTTVYKAIGQPAYKKIKDIELSELPMELERIHELLFKGNISLDTLCEVDDYELYRFITEELFPHEMDNMNMPGMMNCFIYEEFHPNADYDIRHAVDYFFRFTLAKMEKVGGEGYDMLYVDTKHYINSKGEELSEEKVVNTINNFLKSFDTFKVITNVFENISINPEETEASFHFSIEYQGLLDSSEEAYTFKGKGLFKLRPSEYGGWSIYHMDLPGLKI